MRRKRVLKRNDYSRVGDFLAKMPSGAHIYRLFVGGVAIYYPCGTTRWISDNWCDDEYLKELTR